VIFTLIFEILIGLFTAIFAPFPTFTGPTLSIEDNVHHYVSLLGGTGGWLPLTLIQVCFATLVPIVLACYIVGPIIWLYDKFPGKAT
jgi:hypothetical protein